GKVGDWWDDGTTRDSVGTAALSALPFNAMFIETAPTSGRFYDGASAFRGGQFRKPVKGSSFTNVGDFVCASGAVNGVGCWLKVNNTGMRDCTPKVGCVFLIGADSVLSTPSSAFTSGDSGGPVFSLTGDETGGIARGII